MPKGNSRWVDHRRPRSESPTGFDTYPIEATGTTADHRAGCRLPMDEPDYQPSASRILHVVIDHKQGKPT